MNQCVRDTTIEALRALKPAFKKDGTVTAGNAPPVNDGASALVVMAAEKAHELHLALARIVGQATSGLAPKLVLMTPVDAVRRVLAKTGWSMSDVDLVELNEAFSVQALAVANELGLDESRMNVNGGAVALGHAIGSSGGRVLTTLLYALKQRGFAAASPRCALVAATAWRSPWRCSSDSRASCARLAPTCAFEIRDRHDYQHDWRRRRRHHGARYRAGLCPGRLPGSSRGCCPADARSRARRN